MRLEAAIVPQVCCVSGCQMIRCGNTMHEIHASPGQNLGIIEVSNDGGTEKEYRLFMIQKR